MAGSECLYLSSVSFLAEMLSEFHHSYDVNSSVARSVQTIMEERLKTSSDFDKEEHPHCTDFYRLHPRER
jgi:hypothetical protein